MLAKITLPEPQRTNQYQDQEKMEQLELITSGVAHDFNNLLTSILGQSSLALKQLSPEDGARRHIEKAIKAAEYAALLTRQLLTFAKNGLCESQAVNLNQIVSDNAGLLKTVFMDNITLQLDLCRHMPLIIATPGQIQQVVMNLIINAAESIQSKRGTVTVRTGKQRLPRSGNAHFNGHQSTEDFVYFQVSDTGCGIDDTTLSRIFDPFFTTKPSGKGVGLSAVRDIVSAYQGEITVDSTPGQGTTVTVYLPCHRDELTSQLIIH
jgi:two-component system cell cycle sensor histidine kinase/response regulator CckA